MIRALATTILLLTPFTSLFGQSRTYAGTFNTRWRTIGPHGHDQPACAPVEIVQLSHGTNVVRQPDCNPSDFARGNLDNSIGFRAGRERDLLARGAWSIVGGVEGAMNYTEYNLSQADFVLLTAAATGGVDVALGPLTLGMRAGLGPFMTSDGAQKGLNQFHGAHLTFPMRNGVGVRVARQTMRMFLADGAYQGNDVERRHPRAAETSVLLVATPASRLGRKLVWEFSASTGTTTPGGPIGSSRMLRSSAFTTVSAFRDLPWHGLYGRVSWVSSAHESARPTSFLGYDGNYRSKTIDSIGLGVGRAHSLPWHLSMRYGAGVETADWRDDHQLLTRNGAELIGGVELGLNADVALRFHIGGHLALETAYQRVYWQGIDLGEGRWSLGMVVTKW
jgi:hypothetical protein